MGQLHLIDRKNLAANDEGSPAFAEQEMWLGAYEAALTGLGHLGHPRLVGRLAPSDPHQAVKGPSKFVAGLLRLSGRQLADRGLPAVASGSDLRLGVPKLLKFRDE